MFGWPTLPPFPSPLPSYLILIDKGDRNICKFFASELYKVHQIWTLTDTSPQPFPPFVCYRNQTNALPLHFISFILFTSSLFSSPSTLTMASPYLSTPFSSTVGETKAKHDDPESSTEENYTPTSKPLPLIIHPPTVESSLTLHPLIIQIRHDSTTLLHPSSLTPPMMRNSSQRELSIPSP